MLELPIFAAELVVGSLHPARMLRPVPILDGLVQNVYTLKLKGGSMRKNKASPIHAGHSVAPPNPRVASLR